MGFVPVENVIEAEMRYLWDSQAVENTLYFLNSDAVSIGSLVTLANVLNDWWGANIQANVVGAVELREIYLADLTSATSSVYSFTAGLPLAGTKIGEGVPANVAPCISFKTAFRGRSNRGRNYLIGCPQDEVNGNHLTSSWMASMVDAYEALAAAVDAESFTHVVVSRYSGSTIVGGKKIPTPRVAGIATPITSYTFSDDVVDSQRGRLPNH